MGGGNVETYKSLGDVFGIQAAVDSMKTAAYANQEMAATSSVSNVNGNHSIHDLSHPRNNQTDTEKRSNGGKIFVYTLNEFKIVCFIVTGKFISLLLMFDFPKQDFFDLLEVDRAHKVHLLLKTLCLHLLR